MKKMPNIDQAGTLCWVAEGKGTRSSVWAAAICSSGGAGQLSSRLGAGRDPDTAAMLREFERQVVSIDGSVRLARNRKDEGVVE